MRLSFLTTLILAGASLLGALAYTIVFGGGVSMDAGADLSTMDSMRYVDAMAYMNSHSRPMSGWQAFLKSAPHWLFWKGIAQLAFAMFAVALGALLAVRFWTIGEDRGAT